MRDPRTMVPTLVLHTLSKDGRSTPKEIAAIRTIDVQGKEARQLRAMQRRQRQHVRTERQAEIRTAKQELHESRHALLRYARERSGIANLSWADAQPMIAAWVAEEAEEATEETETGNA